MKKLSCIICLIPCLFLASCTHYRAQALPAVETVMSESSLEKEQIKVGAKFLNSAESKSYFGTPRVAKKYQPVLLAIENNSNQPVIFHKSSMSHEIINPEEVAKQCKFNTVGRAVGYGAASLAYLPAAAILMILTVPFPATFLAGYLIFTWPFAATPAAVETAKSYKANVEMQSDYSFKGIQDAKIEPGMKIYGVAFFEPMEEDQPLELSLIKENSNKPIRFSFSR